MMRPGFGETVLVIALGNESASDDGAALRAVAGVQRAEVILAGRPGPGLLDLLDAERQTILVDVVRSGASPGAIFERPLAELVQATIAERQTSSHGFGPAETLRLGQALGRRLAPGVFVGIEGREFGPGTELSAPVAAKLDALRDTIQAWVDRMGRLGRGQGDGMGPN